jgi:hypothetical protein
MFRGARRDIAKTSPRALRPRADQPQVYAARHGRSVTGRAAAV